MLVKDIIIWRSFDKENVWNIDMIVVVVYVFDVLEVVVFNGVVGVFGLIVFEYFEEV